MTDWGAIVPRITLLVHRNINFTPLIFISFIASILICKFKEQLHGSNYKNTKG